MKPLISNIITGITGSDASISAGKYAIVMAKNYHCQLSMIYVVDTATIKQLTLHKIFVPEESIEYERSLEANGERYLSFMDELARSKGIKITKEIRRGAVYTEILTAAEEHRADLIVMGGWEKERSVRDIIGNAHHEIMINAKCSVLVVKESNIDQIFKQA